MLSDTIFMRRSAAGPIVERISTAAAILSVPQPFKDKELSARLAGLPQLAAISLVFLKKDDMRKFKKNAPNAVSVCELLQKTRFSLKCDPELLEAVQRVRTVDPILRNFLALVALHSYVAFVIQVESDANIAGISQVLGCLFSFAENVDYQKLFARAICDSMWTLTQTCGDGAFESVFTPLSDFLMFSESADASHFAVIPRLLTSLITLSGYDSESGASRLSSLVAALLVSREAHFTAATINNIFSVLQPYLYQLNDVALTVFCKMQRLLDSETVIQFSLDLPLLFTPIIREYDPVFYTTGKREAVTFEPCLTPENMFSFSDYETFSDGFDVKKRISFPVPELSDLVPVNLVESSDVLVNVVASSPDLCHAFLNSLARLLKTESDSGYYIDYVALAIRFWFDLTKRQTVKSIEVPAVLFDPFFTVLTTGDKKLFSLRYFGVGCVLQITECSIEAALMRLVRYPVLFSEIVEICVLRIDQFGDWILKSPNCVRTLRLVGLQLQHHEVVSAPGDKHVEQARMSLFRLLFHLFNNKKVLILFFSDALFTSFFASLLFERNVSHFVLEHICKFMNCDDSIDPSPLLASLNDVIERIYAEQSTENGYRLETRLLETINTTCHYVSTLLPLCASLQSQLDELNATDAARDLLIQIVMFMTSASLFQELPTMLFKQIEKALKRFGQLDLEIYNALVCMLAGDCHARPDAVFDIKNGETLISMFRCFGEREDVDVIEFVNKLCLRSNNCVACNRCGFDLVLLDYVFDHRDDENSKLVDAVLLFSSIAVVTSSAVVVHKFISLFVPIGGRYVSPVHHVLLQPLQHILTKARESPAMSIPMDQMIKLNVALMIANHGFTFICWLNLMSDSETRIVSVRDDSGERLVLANVKGYFAINGSVTVASVPRRRWTLVAMTYADDTVTVYADGRIACTSAFKATLVGTVTLHIGGVRQTIDKIGSFGVFRKLSQEKVAMIFDRGPRSVQTGEKHIVYYAGKDLAKISSKAWSTEARTFTDILLRFFKIEILVPLFAQLDLTLSDGSMSLIGSPDVVSVMSAALHVGENEQRDFAEVQGFSIIGHLLFAASARHVSFSLYTAFFHIFEDVIRKDLCDEVFSQILMNFDVWIQCSGADHLKILAHWRESIFPAYNQMFLAYFKFETLLDRLRMYYWYEPVEMANIRGDPGSVRPRNSDIDVKASREILFNLLFDISVRQFHPEDFASLLDHCITVNDPKQKLDMLRFMKRIVGEHQLPMMLQRLVTYERLLLDKADTDMILAVIDVVLLIHAFLPDEKPSIGTHLRIITDIIVVDSVTPELLKACLDRLIDDKVYELFSSCALMANIVKDVSMYQNITPCGAFVTEKFWAMNSVVAAINSSDGECECILSFLAHCRSDQWLSIFDAIRLCCIATNADCDNIACRYLSILCLITLSGIEPISVEVIGTLLDMICFHVFFRSIDGGFSGSALLRNAIMQSPFADESLCNMRAMAKVGHSVKSLCELGGLDFKIPGYVLRLRVAEDGALTDASLVRYALKLLSKFRNVHRLNFGLYAAAFLSGDRYKYTASWLTEMNLTQADMKENFSCICLLAWKGERCQQLVKMDVDREEVMAGVAKALDEMPALSKPNVAEGVSEISMMMQQEVAHCKELLNNAAVHKETEGILRLSRLMETVRQNLEKNAKLWQRLWHNMTVDNAPWDPSMTQATQSMARWKRDKTLCNWSFPSKMKRNWSFRPHVEAAISRDAGSNSSAECLLRAYQERLAAEYKANAPPEILDIPVVSVQKAVSVMSGSFREVKATYAYEWDCELIKARRTKAIRSTFKVGSSLAVLVLSTQKAHTLAFDNMKRVLQRRRFHHQTAIEIFMKDGSSYFLNFPKYKSIDIIKNMSLPDSVYVQKQDVSSFVSSVPAMEQWAEGKISNFAYLMHVNTSSGRSFNDTSQYPFFPWVIGDYESEELDLTSPAVYRDLSKPVGAIGETRFKELRDRMESVSQFGTEPYMYSSFAICPLSIYLWFVRMEPFTSLHIEMQSGKFDHPSRLFSSVSDTFRLATTRLNDYRELPPEFYFMPEFLCNENEYDLGKARGVAVADAILPPWAHGSPVEFCYKLRKALESDYVSQHLNEWIDLYFGFKQTGRASMEAFNLYHPDMYEKIWKPATLKDPMRRAEIEASMCHVGQLPPQVFVEPHVKRSMNPLTAAIPKIVSISLEIGNVSAACVQATEKPEIVVVVNDQMKTFAIQFKGEIGVVCSNTNTQSIDGAVSITTRGPEVIVVLPTLQAMTTKASRMGKWLSELGNVSCVATSKESVAVISDAATLNLAIPPLSFAIPFFGDSVQCCAVSQQFGIAVGSTISGAIVICSLFSGKKSNMVKLGSEYSPIKTLITEAWGFILTYASKNDGRHRTDYLFVHNVNGRFIRSVQLPFVISSWCTWSSRSDFDYVLCSDCKGGLFVFEAFYASIGECIHHCHEEIASLSYLPDSHVGVAVSRTGRVTFLPLIV